MSLFYMLNSDLGIKSLPALSASSHWLFYQPVGDLSHGFDSCPVCKFSWLNGSARQYWKSFSEDSIQIIWNNADLYMDGIYYC